VTTDRVLLAEPRRPHREALVEALSTHPSLQVVATADAAPTVALQAQRTRPQVVLLSPAFNGSFRAVCTSLQRLDPCPRTLAYDASDEPGALLDAIEVGVDGYLTAGTGIDALVQGAQAVARGEALVPPTMLGPLLRGLIDRQRRAAGAAARLDKLTRREREVLGHLVEGLDQQQIASRLHIAPDTARTHVQRVLRKLEVHSRLEAVSLVARLDAVEQLGRAVERNVP
jgi:two-component system, NarL family, response regulator LiaR